MKQVLLARKYGQVQPVSISGFEAGKIRGESGKEKPVSATFKAPGRTKTLTEPNNCKF
jgi:hypothetical protein